MANYLATDTDLTAVANAIRTKGGTSASLSFPSGFVTAIGNIPGGAMPSGIAEIKAGEYNAETVQTTTVSISHGCSGTPDIIIVWSNYKTVFTPTSKPVNGTFAGGAYNGPNGNKYYVYVGVSYEGTDDAATGYVAGLASTDYGQIQNVGSTTFDIKCTANRRMGPNMTYKWIAIRLS